MTMVKRIFLFLLINFFVVMTISFVLNLLNVQPFLSSYGLNIKELLIFCLVWGMGGAFISLALSRIMAKWMMGVKLIDPNTQDPEALKLLNLVYHLSRQAGLPDVPQVGIYESPEVNAFATGPTKRKALVAVSRGLLNKMGQKEIEGVLAHEITHVANGDMVTLTLIQGIVNAFVMFLARVLAFVFSGMGKSRQESSSSAPSYFTYMMLVFVFEIVFMLLGSIVIAFFSRWREYRADKGGAELAGKQNMIAALQSLLKMQKTRDPAAEKPSVEAMKISSTKRSSFMTLFSTHPPLEKRIARLELL